MNLIDLKTLSKQVSVSIFTLRKYVRIGMPHYRAGRKILVDPFEFESWFQQFKTASSPSGTDLSHLVNETLNKVGIFAS